MSRINYNWSTKTPPKPDVYVTRRGCSKYLTHRYWDGERWFEVAIRGNRTGIPFTWPKHSVTREPKPQSWEQAPWITPKRRYELCLRKIHKNAHLIQWGTEYTVYDDKEVIRYLVEVGKLPKDWKTCYQQEMRDVNFR